MAIWNQPGGINAEVTDELLNELKTNYKAVESSIAFSPVYSATINNSANGQDISTNFSARINEIRTAINGLEQRMSNNCNCNNCCQTCESCQECQTCQTCQGCQTCQTCQTYSQCYDTCQSCQTKTQCSSPNCNCNCDCTYSNCANCNCDCGGDCNN